MENNLEEFDDVSVVIVTFNNEKTIKECLDSVFESDGRLQVIVVDNNSQDKTREIIKKYLPRIEYIGSEKNFGFAKANNLGVSRSNKKYILFLNPDTEVLNKRSIFLMREALICNPQFGIIGPKMIFADGRVQLSVRNSPTVIRAFEEYILDKKNSYEFYLPLSQTLCEVESIKGAVMLIEKDVFERVGGFDERYFMYFEDLELCKALRKIKLKIGYLPSVVFKHIEGVSGKGENTKELALSSAKIYHGIIEFYLIQILGRIGNKIKSVL